MKYFTRSFRKSQARKRNLLNFKRFCADLDEYILGLEPRLFPDSYYDETKPLVPSRGKNNGKDKGQTK